MLLRNEIIDQIIAGKITVLFRRWRKATVKKGGTQMTRKGVLGIDAIDVVTEDKITEKDARAAGFANKKALLDEIRAHDRDGEIYRIRLHFVGEDPRVALRESSDLTADELSALMDKLAGMDATSKRGPWSQLYLQMIKDQPQTHAIILARSVGLDNLTFKPQVRRLKALGLTESLRPGYRLSPRGEKVLAALRSTARSTKTKKAARPKAIPKK
ncbi:MAG: hypothetical protein ABIP75_15995 [Pyrinomonadaceae bacterium]